MSQSWRHYVLCALLSLSAENHRGKKYEVVTVSLSSVQTIRYINSMLNHEKELNNTYVNTLRPRQNGRRFADDTFKRIFLNENVRISIKISLKFLPKGPINNNPALVQIMAWCRSGGKPLSEPMVVSLLTHICVTGPQWINIIWAVLCWHLTHLSTNRAYILKVLNAYVLDKRR